MNRTISLCDIFNYYKKNYPEKGGNLMKLTNEFSANIENLHRMRMNRLFSFEEGDLEKYPQARIFLEEICSSDLHYFIQEFKMVHGFFRANNSKAKKIIQKDISNRFPLEALLKVSYIKENLKMLKIAETDFKYSVKVLNASDPQDHFKVLCNWDEYAEKFDSEEVIQ